MEQTKRKLYRVLSNLNGYKWRLTVKALAAGLVAGLLASFYRKCIEFGSNFAVKLYNYLGGHLIMLIPWVIVLIVVGLILALIVRLEPMSGGSGIPQVEGVVLFGLKMKWQAILLARFIGGTLCALCGLSLGREGPSIQSGAAGSKALAGWLCKDDQFEENYLVTGGAAAGLSAAFNAPIAGVVFVLEEVHRSFSPFLLICAMAASLTADFVSKYFFGLSPVLNFSRLAQLPYTLYLFMIPVGIFSGFVGAVMNKMLLLFQKLYEKIPQPARPCVALLISVPCGLFFPYALGGGQGLIGYAHGLTVGIVTLSVLLVVKMLYTGTSFGSGVPGGILMPILTVGALSGSIMGIAIVSVFNLSYAYVPFFALCAMAGAFTGCVKTPITGILLTAEMSGSLVHLLPAAICAFVALLVSDLLKTDPVYEVLLGRFVEKHGRKAPAEEKGGLHEMPVELGSVAAGCRIRDVAWPEGFLIVGLRRGEKELVPEGKTEIFPGDYLLFLVTEKNAQQIQTQAQHLCTPPAAPRQDASSV